MSDVVVFTAPREAAVRDEALPPLEGGQVRVETLYSGISAGTELTAYRGSNPYLHKRWDPDRRLFVEADGTSLEYPVEGWGYEEVGRIREVGPGVQGLAPGTLVWGAWGHRASAAVPAERAGACVMPGGLDARSGIFSRIGAIALNAVLDADIHVGEVVAVFGQGVPGLIVGQLAALNGATVVAVDAIPKRLELARALGAAHVIDARAGDAAAQIKALSEGRGADVSIEITGSYRALHEAIRATAYSSRVVASGFFQGDGAGLFLGEEFHHNRIEVVCSQISGVSPRLDHRWDLRRLEQTIMRLAADGRVNLDALVSHVFAIDRAAEAFALLDQRPEDAVQVVLDFQHAA
ncbi:MAG TPA: zinc-binding alcohol dehydrogenase [Solirubrobacteraceae bacterium]|nr:zinc-binding alcohol dehydrogenase [Solirubrobacteraceae bacterium]